LVVSVEAVAPAVGIKLGIAAVVLVGGVVFVGSVTDEVVAGGVTLGGVVTDEVVTGGVVVIGTHASNTSSYTVPGGHGFLLPVTVTVPLSSTIGTHASSTSS
jgi:hypothetical protein